MQTPEWAVSIIKRISPEGNPLWPLPPDYNDLSAHGQNQARVNACRQYLLDWGSMAANGAVFADCVEFFDKLYLWPDVENGHFPQFYDQAPLPGADFHKYMQETYWNYTWQSIVAPRGGTKSMQIRKRILLRMTAERGFSNVYATSTDKLAKIAGSAVRRQFLMNDRLLRDWANVYDEGNGRLAPTPRGAIPISTEQVELFNGSVSFFASAGSRQRGRRPIVYEFDDPEYDPESESTNMEAMREGLSDTIFRVIGPMMTRPGAKLVWTGTFLSAQHLLWAAMDEERQPDGTTRPRDKRFLEWKRSIIKAAQEDSNGEPSRSNWPHMWPINEKERNELNLSIGTVTIPMLRKRFGEEVWQAEFQANPGAVKGSYFPFNRASDETKDRFGYTMSHTDEYTFTDPARTKAVLHWNRWEGDSYTPVEFPLAELIQQCRPIITADTAYSDSDHSDWKVAHVLLWTPQKEVFSLDLFDTHNDENYLVKVLFDLANRWKAWGIFPETTNTQRTLAKSLQQYVVDRLPHQMGCTHIPAVMPLHVGRESKQTRQASFRVWFDLNKVKLPFDRMHSPAYNRLYNQIEGFTPQLRDGGLRHDDHLDTLEMAQRTIKVSTDQLKRAMPENDKGIDVLGLLKAGHSTDPKTGLPLSSFFDPNLYTMDQLLEAVEGRKHPKKNESVA
jgi:hypothetical protein